MSRRSMYVLIAFFCAAAVVSLARTTGATAADSNFDLQRTVQETRDELRSVRQDVNALRTLLESDAASTRKNSDGTTAPVSPILTGTKNALYYFYAPWCGPCRKMNPTIERLRSEGYPIVDVDIDTNQEMARQFAIERIPSVVLVVDGKMKLRDSGLQVEAALRSLLTHHFGGVKNATLNPALPDRDRIELMLKADANADRVSNSRDSDSQNKPATTAETTKLEVRTYPVADLVTPVPGKMVPSVDESFEKLIALVSNTIEPASWAAPNGNGAIHKYDQTLSLVIRQTPEVHQRIVHLLSSLRSLHSWQIVLDLAIVENPPADLLATIGAYSDLDGEKLVISLSDAQKAALLAAARRNPTAKLGLCKAILYFGQGAAVPSRSQEGEELSFQTVDSTDRYSVGLSFSGRNAGTKKATRETVTAIVPNLNTVLMELKRLPSGDANKKRSSRTFVIVQPRILLPEEEEESLGQ